MKKTPKLLLADFYLELLAIPATDPFSLLNSRLYLEVLKALAKELHEDEASIKRIFEKMALEDRKQS